MLLLLRSPTGLSLNNEILADTPLLYWPLSETSGTNFVDHSGHGRDGTLVGGSATLGVDMGTIGRGLLTAGSSGYVTGPNLSALITSAWSMEIWLNAASLPGINDATLMTDNGFIYNWINTSGALTGYDFRTGNGNRSAASSSGLSTSALHQIVFVANTSGGTYYIDGVAAGTFTPAGSGNWSDANTGSGLSIGYEPATSSRPLTAKVAHAAVYDHVLTADRVQAHYLAGTGQTSLFVPYSGAYESFTVPAGVTTIHADLSGAAGGPCADVGTPQGGKGGRVQCDVTVTPGEVLRIYVGGAGVAGSTGGFNGGGGTAGGGAPAGSGGGATDIRRTPYAIADRLVVAGGGGGQGENDVTFSHGGYGGTNGSNGGDGSGANKGTGGLSGGNGGTHGTGPGGNGTDSSNGTGGTGGATTRGGAGGGGGYVGGGGGGGASSGGSGGGGGGGSSFTTGVASTITDDYQVGNGYAVLTFTASPDLYGQIDLAVAFAGNLELPTLAGATALSVGLSGDLSVGSGSSDPPGFRTGGIRIA